MLKMMLKIHWSPSRVISELSPNRLLTASLHQNCLTKVTENICVVKTNGQLSVLIWEWPKYLWLLVLPWDTFFTWVPGHHILLVFPSPLWTRCHSTLCCFLLTLTCECRLPEGGIIPWTLALSTHTHSHEVNESHGFKYCSCTDKSQI